MVSKIFFAFITAALASASLLTTNYVSGTFTNTSGQNSGALGWTNVSRAISYAVQITAAPSGNLSGVSAVLYGSNDCVNFAALPVKATGDNTKSANLTTVSGTSGNFILSETELSTNCIEVYYTANSGTVNIQQNTSVRGNNINQ